MKYYRGKLVPLSVLFPGVVDQLDGEKAGPLLPPTAEQSAILHALNNSKSVAIAAAALGIKLTDLYAKMRKNGIKRPQAPEKPYTIEPVTVRVPLPPIPAPAPDLNSPVKTLAAMEREAILEAVNRLGVVRAARELGMGRTTVYRKLEQYRHRAAMAAVKKPVQSVPVPLDSITWGKP